MPTPTGPGRALRRTRRRLARRAGFWWRYGSWRLRHPGAGPADYYVERFRDRLARPGSHANLGNLPAEPERTRAFAVEVLRRLRELGMRPGHRCVDFGCGSLHVGELLIEHLAPGRYLGLDVTPVFYEDALRRLPADWLARKRPRLATLSEAVLAELRASPPDFLVCTHVAILVPPRALRRFARTLTSLLGPQTRCLLELQLRRRPRQATDTFFWHSEERIARAFRREGHALRPLGRFPPIRDGQRESRFVTLVRR